MNPALNPNFNHLPTLLTLDKLFEVGDIVYISGPMSGFPDDNRPLFTRVKRLVAEATGSTVISPADIKQGPPWEQQIRQCIRYISDSTKILMLPGWENSRGALIEHLIACQILIPRWYLQDNLLRASSHPVVKMDVRFMTRFMEERIAINTAENKSETYDEHRNYYSET